MKILKKITTLALVGATVFSLSSCRPKAKDNKDFTYYSYTTALGTNWNPHTWETNADSGMLGYIESPFVDVTIKNSKTGEYQWVYEMATSIEDVTASHRDDLTKYKSTLPESAKSWDEVDKDFVYEIKLNPKAQWQDGTPINADSYIYSMKQLLAPELQNYRANNYYTGESAIAGAFEYYHQGSDAFAEVVTVADSMDKLSKDAEGNYKTEAGNPVYVTIADSLAWLDGNALADYVDAYGDAMFDVAAYEELGKLADEKGRVRLNDTTLGYLVSVITKSADWGETAADAVNYLMYSYPLPEVGYDETVGLYKVDDYTIRYVLKNAYEEFYFKVSMSSNWLVHEKTYEACKKFDNGVYTTTYGTSLDTTVSYGAYKMESLQDAKQVTYVQNENWYGYTKNEDGTLYSETTFEVDGAKVQQYKTTKIVIDVMTPDAAKLAFESGKLSEYAPTASELPGYSLSEQLYKADETYTMRLFYNTNLDALKEMDKSKGNTNSVVMSNENFRKAFSLAVDRTDWVSTTAGYKPSYSLINSLYYYNVAHDPESIFRNTPEAMQAICDIYGVTYGEGKEYATLEEAYAGITGYNLAEAKKLMKTACDELVADGLYTKGQEIKIRMAWKAGAPDADDHAQVAKLNEYINAAVEGSGFGKVTLELVGNLNKRYEDVPNGEYAIGYGAWGGAAFYPFTMFQVYMDPDHTALHEAGCWDPTTETLTLTVGKDADGNPVTDTMTYQKWSGCLAGEGKYANADNSVKLYILAQLEKAFIEKYYCMPLATTTVCSLVSYQCDYYTDNYNIMYGYGGIRLMSYNYNDAEWAEYVEDNNGQLSYK